MLNSLRKFHKITIARYRWLSFVSLCFPSLLLLLEEDKEVDVGDGGLLVIVIRDVQYFLDIFLFSHQNQLCNKPNLHSLW